MSADDIARVLKLLEKTGYEGTFNEFTGALSRFKAHPEAVAALRRGVDRRGKQEDRGSYCENASSGYSLWYKKNQELEKLDLENDRVFLNEFNTNALPAAPRAGREVPPATPDDIAELQKQVQELTRRVTKLEAHPAKFKLG